MRTFDVLCGYALELVMSTLRGVRTAVGRLLTDADSVPLRPARARASAKRSTPLDGGDTARLAGDEAIRDALASPTPLPAAYGDDRLVLLARDPQTLFAYWDLTPGIEVPGGAADARLVLRVDDLTLLHFDDARAWRHDDIDVDRPVGSCYVPLDAAGGTFRAEIGWRWRDDRFVARVRSAAVTTARDAAGQDPMRWMTVRRDGEPARRTGAETPPRLSAEHAPAPVGAPVATRVTGERPKRRAPASEELPRRGG